MKEPRRSLALPFPMNVLDPSRAWAGLPLRKAGMQESCPIGTRTRRPYWQDHRGSDRGPPAPRAGVSGVDLRERAHGRATAPQNRNVRSYLKAVGRNHGLILNFTKPKLDIKRVLAPPNPDSTYYPAFLPSSEATLPTLAMGQGLSTGMGLWICPYPINLS